MKLIYIFFIIIFAENICAQNFEVSSLISIPGDNRNFSIISPTLWRFPAVPYICWENQKDTLFTIYLKKLDLDSDSLFIVCSDTLPNINPEIAYYNEGIRIVWQSLKNNKWVIYSRLFKDEQFENILIESDTTKNCITPVVSNSAIAWIQDGKLTIKFLSFEPQVIDSGLCRNPVMSGLEYYSTILYEKVESSGSQIYMANNVVNNNHWAWDVTQLSESGFNINPSFGIEGAVSYQSRIDSIWKVSYNWFYPDDIMLLTNNTHNNYEHPVVFSYPVPAGIKKPNTGYYPGGYFIAFDSDSLQNNKDIFIKYWRHNYIEEDKDTLINISNVYGEDTKPELAVIKLEGRFYRICIVWEHKENNKTDIWWATAKFYFSTSDASESEDIIEHFDLKQNYPNPFNPSTKIRYSIPIFSEGKKQSELITLKIYDILGNEIATLVNEEKPAGEYEVEFDGSRLASGVYFYNLVAGEKRLTGKMNLIK